jgi:hypothetical protein
MTISHAPDGSVHPDPRRGLYTLRAGHRRWLVLVYGRELRLVDNEEELRRLVQQGYVGTETPVYEVGAGPHTVGSVPELARIVLETPSPGVTVDEDLETRAQILDCPLEPEIEFDEVPVSRWPGRVAFLAGLGLVCVAGYLLVGAHFGAPPPSALAARLSSAARSVASLVVPARAATAAKVAPALAGSPSPLTPAVALPAALPGPAPSSAQPAPDSDPPPPSASAAERPSSPDQPRGNRRHRPRQHRHHHGRS